MGVANVGDLRVAVSVALAANPNCDLGTMLVVDVPGLGSYAVASVAYAEDLAGALVITAGHWLGETDVEPAEDAPEPVRFTRNGEQFDLRAGHEYIVRYRIEGQRFDRQARLGFAGRHASTPGRLLFDADTGTEGGIQTFEVRWILAAEQVVRNLPARYIGRRAPELEAGRAAGPCRKGNVVGHLCDEHPPGGRRAPESAR